MPPRAPRTRCLPAPTSATAPAQRRGTCRAWADQMLAALREAASAGVVVRWAEDDELQWLLCREGVRPSMCPRAAS
jgi:hypothetical protein